MATNVVLGPHDKWSRCEVLSWLNSTLQTDITMIEHLCSGKSHPGLKLGLDHRYSL